MSSTYFSLRNILLLILSFGLIIGATTYVGAATVTQKPIVKKITCKAGNEPNARGTKCTPCAVGNVSSNGLTCRACRGDNIAKNKGSASCTACPKGTKANTSHTKCIKQRYVSGERK
ncbi:hypothetical protein KBD33_00130 [Candidatus Gracilibacteria bacterium]|nr:hypothetical protein [Candidatus Gracilibacteria bacterium]